MNYKTIGSQTFGIEIITQGIDHQLIWDAILNNSLLYKFIPDLKLDNYPTSKIDVVNLELKKYRLNKSKAYIQGVFNNDYTSSDIIVLCESILERNRQEIGIYTIHSSAIHKNGKGILFMGNLTGLGKTSTALFLCKINGYTLYSDEKTSLNSATIGFSGQTKKIYIESKTKERLSDYMNVQSEIEIVNVSTPPKLSYIIIPVVTNDADNLVAKLYSLDQTKWMLYEELTKDIRLINGSIFNMTTPLRSLDTQSIAQARLNFAISIAETIPCYYIQGSLTQISQFIENLQ